MSTPDPTPVSAELEQDLRAITTWQGEPTALWKSALDQASASLKPAGRRRTLWFTTILAAAALVALSSGALWTAMNSVRETKLSVGHIAIETGAAADMKYGLPAWDGRVSDRADRGNPGGFNFDIVVEPSAQLRSMPPTADRPADAVTRSVIRKSTIELAVPDARVAFAKVQHLLRADLSEFVEASTLTGQDKDARAQLTLRVAATGDRLGEVLNQLRALGKVDSENSTGDDVTAQAVDLDARLRNEKQVETEMLRLLESRKDAQLKDILELRERLAQVRQSIERLQGQRDTLSRQINLATILVILRPDNAPKPEPQQGMFDGFTNEMSRAWSGGLTVLTQTIAFIIRVAIGGLIWWLLLFAAIAIARRVIRRMIPDPARVPVSA